MKYELLIIKSKTSIDVDENKFRDDYGEFVVYETNSPEWIVHDKAKYLKEEKFWVFGDNGKKNRKDCYWIYDEFIKKYACSVDNFLNIYIYYNKLFFCKFCHKIIENFTTIIYNIMYVYFGGF